MPDTRTIVTNGQPYQFVLDHITKKKRVSNQLPFTDVKKDEKGEFPILE